MPEPAVTGLPRATFAWFAGLEADNSKAWFTAHRDTYDKAVRGQIEALLDYQLASDQLARFREASADDKSGPELERILADVHGRPGPPARP